MPAVPRAQGSATVFAVLRRMRPWILDETPQTWLASSLGLDAYPIIYRGTDRPRSGALFGPFYRALGGEAALRTTYGAP